MMKSWMLIYLYSIHHNLQCLSPLSPDGSICDQHSDPYKTWEGTNQLDLLQMEIQWSYQQLALAMVMVMAQAVLLPSLVITVLACQHCHSAMSLYSILPFLQGVFIGGVASNNVRCLLLASHLKKKRKK